MLPFFMLRGIVDYLTTTRVSSLTVLLKTRFHCRQNVVNLMDNNSFELVEHAVEPTMYRCLYGIL